MVTSILGGGGRPNIYPILMLDIFWGFFWGVSAMKGIFFFYKHFIELWMIVSQVTTMAMVCHTQPTTSLMCSRHVLRSYWDREKSVTNHSPEPVKRSSKTRPEFLNRIDELLVFQALSSKQLTKIVSGRRFMRFVFLDGEGWVSEG